MTPTPTPSPAPTPSSELFDQLVGSAAAPAAPTGVPPVVPPAPVPKAADLIPPIKALIDQVNAIYQATAKAGKNVNYSHPALLALTQAHNKLLMHSKWIDEYGGK